ncbi:MAG: polymer-forming cytoskeletal protein [Alphaproteobacteria bacterium]
MFARHSKIAEARAALAQSVQAPPFHAATRYGAAPSVVGADAMLFGDVLGACDLRIEGTVEGNIVAPNVTVGEGAHVEGAIYAETAHVAGTINGRIEAVAVSIAKSAQVYAVIYHNTLSIEFGAHVDGRRPWRPRGAIEERRPWWPEL